MAGRGYDAPAGADPRLSVLGFVDSLQPLYERAACALVPLLSGGGSPLKFIEALAHGLPVVATPRAAAGLDAEPGRDYLEGAGADGFARSLVLEALDPAAARRSAAAGARACRARLLDRGAGAPAGMKIVSVMTSEARGGAEYAAVRLLDAVAARGHETVLLTSHPDTADGTRVAARQVELGPKLGSRTWPRLALTWPLVLRRLRRELSARRPTTCCCSTSRRSSCCPAPAGRAAAAGRLGRVGTRARGRCGAACRGPALRAAPPARVAAVLAISEGTTRSLVEAGVPADRVAVVPERPRPRALPGAAGGGRRPPGALGDPRGRLRDRLPDPLQRQEAQRGGGGRRRCGSRGEPGPPVHLLMIGEGETEAELRAPGGPARRRRPLRAHHRRRARRAALRLRRRRVLPLPDRGRAAGDLDGDAHRAARGGDRGGGGDRR